ncbi:MAG TPA: hypothetical protein VFF02_06860 [Anaeromyxobacteraceae bacterium]|nr:hypothetical protein [Anaeromyxobacteraceae bacterium]
MQGLTALLVLVLDAASVHAAPAPDLRVAAWQAISVLAAPSALARPAPAPADAGARPTPACLGEVCQPQVSVPGYDPQYSLRGLRTQATVQALDSLRLEPVATVVWWLAATGVRLDYTPAALDAAANGGTGVSHVEVLLRWRMDAFGGPAWLERRR